MRGGDSRRVRDGHVREAQAGVTAGRGRGIPQPDSGRGGVQRAAILVGVVGRGGDLRGERRRAAARRRRAPADPAAGVIPCSRQSTSPDP